MRILFKYLFLLTCLCGMSVCVKAQSDDKIFDKYADFNIARMLNKSDTAFKLGAEILLNVGKLSPKTQISFYNGLAKLYEDNSQFDKAQPLYEKIVKAAPDYYVAHLALGHIYLRKVDELAKKANLTGGDKTAFNQYQKDYIAAVKKVLPHLEKVQACDPYDENLALIKKLYGSLKDPAGFAGLESRLKPLQVKCLDILDDN
jgi:tetratricopeptide (TPR) repeat protein